jgi:RNA polymerase sigma-70 factor, ECF subfamily
LASAVSPTIENDLALAQAVLRRDRKASAELVQLYSDPVYRYVRLRLHPRLEAVDDIVQEVFLAAWKGLAGYRGTSPLKSWILGIARHRVEEHYRQLLRNVALPEDAEETPSADPPLHDALDRQSNQERTALVLGLLPDHYRAVLLWRYWDGRSADAIACELQRSPKAVERLLARARLQFRELWDQKEIRR